MSVFTRMRDIAKCKSKGGRPQITMSGRVKCIPARVGVESAAKAMAAKLAAERAIQKATFFPWRKGLQTDAIRKAAKAVKAETKAIADNGGDAPRGALVATRWPGQPCPSGTRGVPRGGKIFCYR